MIILFGVLVFVIACLCGCCVGLYSTYQRYRSSTEDIIAKQCAHLQEMKESLVSLNVELSVRPPNVENWAVGIIGVMEVLEVPKRTAELFVSSGIRFPKSFSFTNGVSIWDKDELLTWYQEDYPKTERLMRSV